MDTSRAAELRGLVERAESVAARVHAMIALSMHLDVMNHARGGVDIAGDACALALADGDAELVGWSHLRRMLAWANIGQFESGVGDGHVAAEAFGRIDHRVGLARATSALADLLLRLERYDEGFAMLIEATLLLESVDEAGVEVLNATMILADAYGALAAYDEAIALNERSLAMAYAMDDPDDVLWARYRLANVLVDAALSFASTDPDRAIAINTRVCDLLDDVDTGNEATLGARMEDGLHSVMLMLRGTAETGRGRADFGMSLLRRSRAIGGALDQSPLEIGRIERSLGRACAATGDLEQGRIHLDDAVRALEMTEAHGELSGALRERSAVAATLGDLVSALTDAQRALQIGDVHRAREIARRATSVSARIDVERGRVELHARERAADELRRMAGEDPLTGIANRRTLDSEGAALVSGCTGEPVSVVVIDIDDFKAINDRHSHLVGDAVLRRVAEILVDRVRPTDLVARYAGDEFVLVLPGADASAVATVEQRSGGRSLPSTGTPCHPGWWSRRAAVPRPARVRTASGSCSPKPTPRCTSPNVCGDRWSPPPPTENGRSASAARHGGRWFRRTGCGSRARRCRDVTR